MAVTKRKSDRSAAKTAASTDVERLSAMVAEGEGPALEFKRSTGELKEAMQTLCAFLNGGGGTVLFGVGPNGSIEGRQVSDRTLRDVVQAGQRFEPPADLTVRKLSGKHDSKPVNPLIAGAFHRTGAVEVWGRGTNRVIDMCRQHGAALPVFEERDGFVYVTFKAPMVVGGAAAAPRDQVTAQVTGQVGGQVTGQVAAQVVRYCQTPRKASEIRALLNLRHRETFVDNYLRPLLETGWLEPTIPDRPTSRLQRYRTTAAGLAILQEQGMK